MEEIKDIKANGEFQEEELHAEKQKIVEEKMRIINDLNKIKYPINATVFTHGQSWTIRNITFWEQMQQRDEDIVAFMETYLTPQT